MWAKKSHDQAVLVQTPERLKHMCTFFGLKTKSNPIAALAAEMLGSLQLMGKKQEL